MVSGGHLERPLSTWCVKHLAYWAVLVTGFSSQEVMAQPSGIASRGPSRGGAALGRRGLGIALRFLNYLLRLRSKQSPVTAAMPITALAGSGTGRASTVKLSNLCVVNPNPTDSKKPSKVT